MVGLRRVILPLAAIIALSAAGQPFAATPADVLPWVAPSYGLDAAPPRCALNTRITVNVNGTIADALRQMAAAAGDLCWICGIPPDAKLQKATFSVNDEPLWQALDRLREAYGYDWGVTPSGIVAWPTMEPALQRKAPRPLPQPLKMAQVDSQRVVRLNKPTAIVAAVRKCWAPEDADKLVVSIHDQLKGWRVVGVLNRSSHYSPGSTASAIAAAAGAMMLGGYPFVYLRPSPLRCLDIAVKYLRAHPELKNQPTAMLGERLRASLLRNHFTAQHRALIRHRLVATVLFWELSPEEAAMFIELARRRAEQAHTQPDYSQPHSFRVEFIRSTSRYTVVLSGADGKPRRTTRYRVGMVIQLVTPLRGGIITTVTLPAAGREPAG